MRPQMATLAEKGSPEMVLPLGNSTMMAKARAGLGVSNFAEGLALVASEVRYVRRSVDYQTQTIPPKIGSAVRSGTRENIALAADYREALSQSAELAALRTNMVGG